MARQLRLRGVNRGTKRASKLLRNFQRISSVRAADDRHDRGTLSERRRGAARSLHILANHLIAGSEGRHHPCAAEPSSAAATRRTNDCCPTSPHNLQFLLLKVASGRIVPAACIPAETLEKVFVQSDKRPGAKPSNCTISQQPCELCRGIDLGIRKQRN